MRHYFKLYEIYNENFYSGFGIGLGCIDMGDYGYAQGVVDGYIRGFDKDYFFDYSDFQGYGNGNCHTFGFGEIDGTGEG